MSRPGWGYSKTGSCSSMFIRPISSGSAPWLTRYTTSWSRLVPTKREERARGLSWNWECKKRTNKVVAVHTSDAYNNNKKREILWGICYQSNVGMKRNLAAQDIKPMYSAFSFYWKKQQEKDINHLRLNYDLSCTDKHFYIKNGSNDHVWIKRFQL